jgi:predicted mannosyl-3-phosphoglycerate phosphatase (HAD superfamily)
MRIVVFLDLDDTLFQTLPKCPQGVPVYPAARARDGTPLSFITDKQRRLLEWLDTTCTVIPVTARNHDAFLRVELPWRGPAILDFGGVILRADGMPEPAWDHLIRPQASRIAQELERVQEQLTALIDRRHLGARVRLIMDFDLPLYVVVKHPDEDLASLHALREELLPALDTAAFFIHHNDNNLSVVPRFLGKEKAVRYVLENDFGGEPILTLGLGDSLTDLPFLQICDCAAFPGYSQLGRALAAGGARIE